MNARQFDEAVSQYTAALSLDPVSPRDLRVKRSRAYAEKGKWEDALNDANEVVYFQFRSTSSMLMGFVQVIKLDPSSPSGYERKYATLLMGHNDDAIVAFERQCS